MAGNDPANSIDALGLNRFQRFARDSLTAKDCEDLLKLRNLYFEQSRTALNGYQESINDLQATRDLYAWSSFAVSTAGSVYNGLRGALKTRKDALASDKRVRQMLGDKDNWQGARRNGLNRGGGMVDEVEYAPGYTYDAVLDQIRQAELNAIAVDAGVKGLITGGVNVALEFDAAAKITGLLNERIHVELDGQGVELRILQRTARWLRDQYEAKCRCVAR